MVRAAEPFRCAHCGRYPAIIVREGWHIAGVGIVDAWAVDCGCERGIPVKGETLQSALSVWCGQNMAEEAAQKAQGEAIGSIVADSATGGGLTATEAFKAFAEHVSGMVARHGDCWVLSLHGGRYLVVYPDGRVGEVCFEGGSRAPSISEVVTMAKEY